LTGISGRRGHRQARRPQRTRCGRENEIRAGERAVSAPPPTDAGLVYIGRIHTPWQSRMITPRQGRHDGPTCRIEVFEPWVAALDSVAQFERLEVLYWLTNRAAIW